jgi:hypothetical protein
VVPSYRNVLSHVPNGEVAEVARVLKAIHAQEDRRAPKSIVEISRLAPRAASASLKPTVELARCFVVA